MVVRKKQPGFCPEAQARFDMSGAELRTHEMKAFTQPPCLAHRPAIRFEWTPACMWARVPGCPARACPARAKQLAYLLDIFNAQK